MTMILLVDDEPPVLEMLKALLERERYEVKTAADGQEALERVQQQRPDLIVSDLFMTTLDGPQLHAHLQQSEQNSGIPIIFMSGTPQTPANLPGPFLRKPFEIEQLLRVMRQLL